MKNGSPLGELWVMQKKTTLPTINAAFQSNIRREIPIDVLYLQT